MTPKQKLERLKEVLSHDDRNLLIEVLISARHAAYDAGYVSGVTTYATWRNGEQLVGCLQRPLKEELATRGKAPFYDPEHVDLLPDHMPLFK